MNTGQPSTPAAPAELSDEAAVMLIAALTELVAELHEHYAPQLQRYRERPCEDQLDLWSEQPL